MAYTDTLTADIEVRVVPKITTTDGKIEGVKQATHKILKRLTDGASSGQAVGFFSETFTSTTAAITLSLADSADPLSTAGDDVPTSDPEGLKLRLVLFENLDDTNYVTLKSTASTGETSIFSGTTDSIKITAGGIFLWTSPAGASAMNDGVDDEFDIQANSASCSVRLTYIFG